ncbi:T9SS type A sorting domain-containing protein [Aquimarina sp. ERC-38]|uniref:T9SS type A sorting domain-containing protein n=1 Tax=Aquimarina sp. ERC-38 TaxID=2949996 RepID=UPI0022450D8F|nr:T9SS type A sorting domain-containing protein [Aquimarina sp. ERC-38]UZO80517.1 T9SS type A sorting domain-containing protein [Aquimarina sp. ERC-38]
MGSLLARTWNFSKAQNGNQLQSLIDRASSGDIIQFTDAGTYNLSNKVINVNKAIIFQGVNPFGYNANTRGSSGIRTVLSNVTSFAIRSSRVRFFNLKINAVNNNVVLIDGRSQRYNSNFRNPGYVADDQYSGIGLTNVELSGGFYSCFAGNGMQVEFKNVSFVNFGRIGYINDRRTRVNNMKKASFFRCLFRPASPNGQFSFDSRGISLDAGNTSYPIVWNAEGTTIRECRFENTGVAISRVKNVNITGNFFYDNNAFVDMIHVEEFSSNVNIISNRFDCAANTTRSDFERSRIITLDSELQCVTDITVKNNTVTGQYNFFINGYAPTNIRITGNNLLQSTPFNPNVINFKYYENRYKTGEGIAANQEFISRNMVITGNKGLRNGGRGCQINVPMSGGNNNVDRLQFAPGKTTLTRMNNPAPLRGNGVYEIVNVGNTSRKLAGNGNNFTLMTKAANVRDNSVKWQITWVPPYYYTIKNVGNNRFLETHKGYTEKEILDNLPQNVYPFLAFQGSTNPKWILRNGGSNGVYKILPAGNEKQSVLAMAGTTPKLIFHKKFNPSGSRSIREPNNFGRWRINPSFARKSADTAIEETLTEGLRIVPNIVDDIASVYFEDDGNPKIKMTLYNAAGQPVMQEEIHSRISNAIDVSQLASGVYIARTSNNLVKRIIVR